ncbi:TPA: hypothetical protein DEP21_03675 [Patescibacteria group bacterium]|nr:hypothetical protein [Candidatus Gracilibacteria bacterium]
MIGTIKLLQSQHKHIYIQAYDSRWLEGFLKQFVDTSNIIFLTEIPKGIRSWIRFLRDGVYKQKWRELFSYAKIDGVIVG